MRLILVFTLLALSARAGDPVSDAKKAQAEGRARQSASQTERDRVAKEVRELRKVLDGVVAGLEKEGVTFDKVQGDSVWNPLPEAVPSKVALEKRRKPPRLIMLPSGGERVYAEVTPRKGGWLVTLESRGKKAEIPAPRKLDGIASRLREGLLSLIATK